MNPTICIVRSGHLGDVVLSEPVASAFVDAGWTVHLCTTRIDVGECLSSYSRVLSFENYLDGLTLGYDRVHVLRYELHRGMHHLDAYASDIGIHLGRRIPQFRTSFRLPNQPQYGLICPDTSHWMAEMRRWPMDRFQRLSQILLDVTGVAWMVLQPDHTFHEMMCLIENAELVVTNDSGPCHVAQAMGRPTVVLFGCTSPEHILVSEVASGVVGSYSCRGCRHVAANRSIGCASPLCIASISIDEVVASVVKMLNSPVSG